MATENVVGICLPTQVKSAVIRMMVYCSQALIHKHILEELKVLVL